jgi:hypothetical protein
VGPAATPAAGGHAGLWANLEGAPQ